MSGALLHGMGDCTPGLNCGCMSHDPEALARVLSGYNFGTWQNVAEAIIADPAPLLAALAEAGVLTEEWAVAGMDRDYGFDRTSSDYPERALAERIQAARGGYIQRRYTTDWTEVQP